MAAEAVATSQSLVAPFDCGPGTGLTCSGNECPERQLSLTTDASGVEKATQSDFFDEESPGPPLPGSRATSTDSTGNEPGSRTESDAFSGDGGSPLPSGTQLPRPSFTNAKEFKANSPAAAVSVSEDEPPVTLSSTAPPSAPEAPAFRSLESCAESDVALAKDFGPEHAQKRQETEAAETEEPDEQGNRARAASRSSSRRPRDNWLNAQPLHIYTSPTDSSSRPTSLERTSSSAFTEKGARAARPRSRWTGDHAESPVTDFQKCGLAGLPPEVLKKSVLALRTQVEDYQKQLVEGSVQLMKAELKVKRLEESLKQREAGTRNAALPQTKGGEASQGENDATVLREENDRLKAELRIANSTADYLQKALRDRSNREIEMKNHIAALTAVNKDLQEQAKTLAALLSRDKTEASLRARRGEHTQAGISENGAMKLDRSPEIIPPIPCTQPTDGALRTKCLGDGDQALSRSQDDFDQSPRPAALLRRTSSSVMHWPSSAERASGKVQFDVCPVFGSVRYDPARTCPVDTALANFVNQRTNKIIFTRVRPGVYLYGRMPVRVQLGTEPETQTKRLEVVARGRRYSIANFINAFEASRGGQIRRKGSKLEGREFAIIDLAHKKTGGLLPLEFSNLPGSTEMQPLAYASAGPGAPKANLGSNLPGACGAENPGRQWRTASPPADENAGFSPPGSWQASRDSERPGRLLSRTKSLSLPVPRNEDACSDELDREERGILRQRSRYPLSPVRGKAASAKAIRWQDGAASREATGGFWSPRLPRKARAAPRLSDDAASDSSPRAARGASRRLVSPSGEGRRGRGVREASGGLKRSSIALLEGIFRQGKSSGSAPLGPKKGGTLQSVASGGKGGTRGADAETRRAPKPRRLAAGGKERMPVSCVSKTEGGKSQGVGHEPRTAKSESAFRSSSLKKSGACLPRKNVSVHWRTLRLSPRIGKPEASAEGAQSSAVHAAEASTGSLQGVARRETRLEDAPMEDASPASSANCAAPHASEPSHVENCTPSGAPARVDQKPAFCAEKPYTAAEKGFPVSQMDVARLLAAAFPTGRPNAISKFPPSSPVREAHERGASTKDASPVCLRRSPDPLVHAFQQTGAGPHGPCAVDPVQHSRRMIQSGLWPIPSRVATAASAFSSYQGPEKVAPNFSSGSAPTPPVWCYPVDAHGSGRLNAGFEGASG
ncbi:conserved hypothetical protein [Neospora caninum Liverpool]|uniref:Uncharacterized protein n=1 Tax=Neospora caninum (strain Liverpool) TaxID=572307 RepID=F0V8A7_NEOCL|nr:conserved hypothetical protein [Neospora caninum Liverpool]CBZ49948.1 conserved hypothetical protein [Neospora caninum Liverpool]|eukprot:XP_003879983.1 conserved hypothetical protein [Neospora caninum Liverpool]